MWPGRISGRNGLYKRAGIPKFKTSFTHPAFHLMKRRRAISYVLVLMFIASPAFAQVNFQADFNVTNETGTPTMGLTVGVSGAATNGFDPGLDQPYPPPFGTNLFYAAILLGGDIGFLTLDLRAGDETSKQYSVLCYPGSGNNTCRFTWTPADFAGVQGPATIEAEGVTKDLKVDTELAVSGITQTTAIITLGFGPEAGATLALNAKLAGAFDAGAMRTDLQSQVLLPLTQPYGDPIYQGTPMFYDGSESVGAFPAGTVDWVLVQVRTGDPQNPPMTTTSTRAALLLSDGQIVDLDGSSPVAFSNPGAGPHYIVIRHRHHLGIMSALSQDLSQGLVTYDFSTAETQAFGVNPMVQIASSPDVFGMIGGDGTLDEAITAFDMIQVWLPDNGSGGYLLSDYNMNGSTTAFDMLLVWLPANGTQSQVPD